MTITPISQVATQAGANAASAANATPAKAFAAPAVNVDGAAAASAVPANAAARFDQVFASTPPLPEHHLLSAAGKFAGSTERLLDSVSIDDRTLDDPTRMLGAQRALTERVLALELVAKVAGAATQGVNKLVHMQ